MIAAPSEPEPGVAAEGLGLAVQRDRHGRESLVSGRADRLDILRRDANLSILEGPDPGFQSLELNQNTVPAFKDVRVRLAMAKAIDRDELAKRGYFGRVLPDVGPIPAAQKLYFREFKRQVSAQQYNPDAAVRPGWEPSWCWNALTITSGKVSPSSNGSPSFR